MENTKALEVATRWATDTITLKDDGLSVAIAVKSLTGVIQAAIDEATAPITAQLAAEQAMCDRLTEALERVRYVSWQTDTFANPNARTECASVSEKALTAYTAHKEGR
jgi:hypothetical protein